MFQKFRIAAAAVAFGGLAVWGMWSLAGPAQASPPAPVFHQEYPGEQQMPTWSTCNGTPCAQEDSARVPDTSPLAAWYYPYPPNQGLAASMRVLYQIVGTGQYVDYFYRTVSDLTIPGTTFYSAMCGPTFGCAWTAHGIGLGQTVSLTINEYRNMPVANYTFWVWIPGYPSTNHAWAVE